MPAEVCKIIICSQELSARAESCAQLANELVAANQDAKTVEIMERAEKDLGDILKTLTLVLK